MTELTKYVADLEVKKYFEKYVNFEEYLKHCEENNELNHNWNSPPYDFNPNELWNSYNKIKIIVYTINFDEETLNHQFRANELQFYLMRLYKTKIKLMNEIYNMENDNSLGLYFGKCNLCSRCTREFNMPCKMPSKMRYSIESLGGNINKTLKDLFNLKKLKITNNKLPEYLVLVGGLLYDKKKIGEKK